MLQMLLRKRRAYQMMLLGGCMAALAFSTAPLISINSDSLYPTLLHLNNAMHFRTPPSSYLFPDILTHAIVRPFTLDGLDEKYLAGFLQLSLTAWACSLILDMASTAFVVAVLYALSPDIALNTASHTGLLLLTALTLWLRERSRWLTLMLFLGCASDPLFLVPVLAICARRPDLTQRVVQRAPWIGTAFLVAAITNEGSVQLLQFYALTMLMLVTVHAGRGWLPARHGAAVFSHLPALMLILTGLLITFHRVPLRYTLPLFMVMLILTLWDDRSESRTVVKATFALTVALLVPLTLFSYRGALPSYKSARQAFDSDWGTAARAIAAARLHDVVVDYWEAKPLALARDINGVHFGIYQMDFRDGTPDTWIAPYDMVAGQAKYRLLNERRCLSADIGAMWENKAKSCGPIAAQTPLEVRPLGPFSLIRYPQPVPNDHVYQQAAVIREGKLSSLVYNMRINVVKLTRRAASAGVRVSTSQEVASSHGGRNSRS